MAIVVQCSCGRTLRAPNSMAGKTAPCICGEVVSLPEPEPLDHSAPIEPEWQDAEEAANEAPILHPPRKKPKRPRVFQTHLDQPALPEIPEGKASGPLMRPSSGKRKRRRDQITTAERKRQGKETILTGIKRSFLFPLRTESLITIGILAFAYSLFTSVLQFVPGGMLAGGFRMMALQVMGTILILGYFTHFLFQIFRIASVDEDDLPLAMDFDQDAILTDLWNWLTAAWWSFLFYGVFVFIAGDLGSLGDHLILRGTILGCCLALLPMALMSAALHLQWLASNPWTALTAICRTATEYFLTLLMFGTLCLVPLAIGYLLPPIPVVRHLIVWLLMFYAVTASAYGFGNFYYRNRKKIGWFGELPPLV